MLERFHLQRLVAVRHFRAEAAARGKRDDLVGGEFPLTKDVEHFAAHVPVAPTTATL